MLRPPAGVLSPGGSGAGRMLHLGGNAQINNGAKGLVTLELQKPYLCMGQGHLPCPSLLLLGAALLTYTAVRLGAPRGTDQI